MGCSTLLQEGYAQLFLDSLCPDKTLILNMAELTNNGLGQWFRGAVHQRHSPSRTVCHPWQRADWGQVTLQEQQLCLVPATKGRRNDQRCSKVMGREREGPSQVPQAASAICISAVPSLQQGLLVFCASQRSCSIATPGSQTNTGACFTVLIYTLLTHELQNSSSLISAIPRSF